MLEEGQLVAIIGKEILRDGGGREAKGDVVAAEGAIEHVLRDERDDNNEPGEAEEDDKLMRWKSAVAAQRGHRHCRVRHLHGTLNRASRAAVSMGSPSHLHTRLSVSLAHAPSS